MNLEQPGRAHAAADAHRDDAEFGAAPFSIDELRTFLAGKIGKHELPVAVDFKDDLPKTTVGKLSRHELRVQEDRQAGGQNKAQAKAG